MQLLQSVGLLPRDLGTLRLLPTERIPTGVELQELFANIMIRPDEVQSEAERTWLLGEAPAVETAGEEAV